MGKIIKREVVSDGSVKTFNRYFNNCRLARAFAKEKGQKVVRVDNKAKGKYLVQYQMVV